VNVKANDMGRTYSMHEGNVYKILVRKSIGTHLGDQGVDGRIILRLIIEKQGVTVGSELNSLRIV
jgi:hypothetical protein